jgi:acyl-CoA dehydrogenase
MACTPKEPGMALDLETRNQLIDTVRRFVRETCIPLEARVSEEDRVPDEVIERMRALGLFGLSIPEEYGGLGLTMEEEVLVAMELGHTSPAFRSVIGTNVGIGSQGVVMFGTEAQKREWLPRLASGEIVSSFCLTEPGAGSDAASLRTTAIRDGEEYVVNGTKRFITNANKAGMFTLMARSDPAKKGAAGISAFIVPAGTKGITIGTPEKKMGQQGAHISDVVFENARVPRHLRLGEEGEGFKVAMQVLDRGRLHISGVCVGVAERLIGDAVAYAREREQFGQRIGDFQLVQAMLADSQTEMYAARCMVLDAARKRDAGRNVTMESACAKYFASEMVGRVADRAVQIFGGAGYVADYGIERFYRDVRIFRIYEGTSQVQQLVIARNLLRDG